MIKNSKKNQYDLNIAMDRYKIKQRCKTTMRLYKLDFLSDDFYDYFCEIKIQNKRKGATFRQLAVDFIREKLGDSRYSTIKPKTKASRELRKNMGTGNYENWEKSKQIVPHKSFEDFVSDSLDAQVALDKMDILERVLVCLYFQLGFNLKEIGEIIGTSDSHACVIIKGALKKAKSN